MNRPITPEQLLGPVSLCRVGSDEWAELEARRKTDIKPHDGAPPPHGLFNRLPIDCASRILAFVSPHEWATVAQVNRSFASAARQAPYSRTIKARFDLQLPPALMPKAQRIHSALEQLCDMRLDKNLPSSWSTHTQQSLPELPTEDDGMFLFDDFASFLGMQGINRVTVKVGDMVVTLPGHSERRRILGVHVEREPWSVVHCARLGAFVGLLDERGHVKLVHAVRKNCHSNRLFCGHLVRVHHRQLDKTRCRDVHSMSLALSDVGVRISMHNNDLSRLDLDVTLWPELGVTPQQAPARKRSAWKWSPYASDSANPPVHYGTPPEM